MKLKINKLKKQNGENVITIMIIVRGKICHMDQALLARLMTLYVIFNY